MADKVARRPVVVRETRPADQRPVAGKWYWVADGDGDRWLGVVVREGSNYVKIEGPNEDGDGHYTTRIHESEFDAKLTPEPNAEAWIKTEVARRYSNVQRLVGEIGEIAASLSVTPRTGIDSASQETRALSVRSSEPLDSYKKALVKAKEKSLPKLFEQIEKENKAMASWMKAQILPLRAEANKMKPVLKAIETRIFNVELYAGLSEEVVQVADGEPAKMGEKVRLFQRRCYMDEECLARYEAGGMEYKDIEDFDAWLVRPENRDRLLPFQRCIVAFQVRRTTKERDEPITSISAAYVRMALEDADKLTFLYIRNGERVFRLSTKIEFGERLFPDLEAMEMEAGKVYAYKFVRFEHVISEGHYLDIVREKREAEAEYRRRKATTPKEDLWRIEPSFYGESDPKNYVKWTPESVYYDDIAALVKDEIDRHNRLVLVLQGLIDRSPALHPHPSWKLYDPQGFADAVELIYDDARALTPGEKPNFEAYRAKLNASLKVGSITVGQEDAWEEVEAERENARRANDWRRKERYSDLRRFRPYGDPGPGKLARIVKCSKTRGHLFRWTKERSWRSEQRMQRRYWNAPKSPFVGKRLRVKEDRLLNVDAYTPGDFRQFFDDPRTRAEYIKWAPLLLEAEEYYAGNREVYEWKGGGDEEGGEDD